MIIGLSVILYLGRLAPHFRPTGDSPQSWYFLRHWNQRGIYFNRPIANNRTKSKVLFGCDFPAILSIGVNVIDRWCPASGIRVVYHQYSLYWRNSIFKKIAQCVSRGQSNISECFIDRRQEAWKKRLGKEKDWLGTHIILDQKAHETFAKNYKVVSIPKYLLIDQTGKIVSADASRPSSKSIKEEITSLLRHWIVSAKTRFPFGWIVFKTATNRKPLIYDGLMPKSSDIPDSWRTVYHLILHFHNLT